ncbi:hypothetical protein PBY51_020166 [Eleginops maclovinus]|uniref:Uncharacterized protein n=1 Tax=Eleginops maclovinus TaxID=56733 RepID=A0AAN7XLA1_ELEMC|nr:hypothetical protein PBY51_020166 [Eleginops maclovinus]
MKGAELTGPTRGKASPGWKQGDGGSKAETGELLPVSLGRGPGECSMCRGLVGASVPPSAACRLIGGTWGEEEGHHMEDDREYAGHPTGSVPFCLLQMDMSQPYLLCKRT